ncbi:MAG: acyl-CoA thioesterase [Deltaproteobacteria bacterium CG11_big_fil_rev_8_21_14_0_20_45_16]|nr:MAG: acyl-CoA thioesterase [Deltaproteobacteria bacterium CG11_big_fil_rev_8_21_14_0_20_45_16]
MIKTEKSSRESVTENVNLVLPSHANALGTAFGGTIISWIDITAAICAQRHSSSICVTASIDALNFLSPALVGDTVSLKAKVIYTGRTSMMIHVDVTAQNLKDRTPRKCADAYLTFVAIDEQRRPKAVPTLKLESDAERIEYELAAKRRESLLAQKAQPQSYNP